MSCADTGLRSLDRAVGCGVQFTDETDAGRALTASLKKLKCTILDIESHFSFRRMALI